MVEQSDITTTYKGMVLELGDGTAASVEVFVGVGGDLADNPGGTATPSNYADDEVDTDGGIGFLFLPEFSDACHSDGDNADTTADLTDDITYMGLEVTNLSAELVGIDGMAFGVWGVNVKVDQMFVGSAAGGFHQD